jgi:RNA polymerase sigma-70 factor (ECF subfamily)
MVGQIKDKILFLRLRKKDKEAFIKAYDLYFDDIYRFVYFKVSDKELAEDITSSVFLKSWDHIQNNSLKDFKTLKALFYKIARNLVIDHYRKTSQQRDVSFETEGADIDIVDEKQNLAERIDLADKINLVQEKMLELKDEYREVITLRYINELSIAEIALILDKSQGNVRILTFRALRALREITEQG